ncbi:MAG: RidA family protein [Candidatus Korobacteraceae bacterium]
MTTSVHVSIRSLIAALVAACAATAALGQSTDKVERIPIPNSDFPISAAVVVPSGYDTIYVSGNIPKVANPNAPKGSTESYGDTKTQTISVLQQIEKTLTNQQLSMADVVMMHVFLVGDPANGGKMDFAGMMAGYTQFFGTREQTNKPARSAVQVAGLAVPGALVEVEVIAVRKHAAQLVH